MNVFIARDGVEIGEFPREELGELAAQNVIRPTDVYWLDGMQDWRRLDQLLAADLWQAPPSASEAAPALLPPPRRIVPVIIGAVIALLVLAIVGFIAVYERKPAVITSSSNIPDAERIRTDRGLRKPAMDAFAGRVDTLPQAPVAPENIFYDNIALSFLPPPAALTASLRGNENTVDGQSGAIVTRTQFVLRADYKHGQWVFKDYRARTENMLSGATSEVDPNDRSLIPPPIVGLLGLQLEPH